MISNDIYQQYRKMIDEGYSQRAACDWLGIARTTMQDYIRRREFGDVTPQTLVNSPRICFYDLECAPSVAVTFGRWKQNIGVDNVLEEGGWLISACWKFLGEDEVHRIVLTPEEAMNRDDRRIVATLWEVFEDVDILVAQNGDRFDWPLIKTRCIAHNFPPPKTLKHIDTLKIAKQLKFNSNRLDSLGKELGLGRKTKHDGIQLWIDCMSGVQSALDEMLEYNAQDVALLEQVYMRLRAFDSKHPNVAHFYKDEEMRCPVCGSHTVEETGNSIFTPVSEFAEVACGDCGHRARKRKTLNTKEKRSTILITPKTTG